MTKLQGVEHNKKGRGLEYLYLNIHDEDRDGKAVQHWCCPASVRSPCPWGRGLDQSREENRHRVEKGPEGGGRVEWERTGADGA